jgi:hypothetical protein
MAQKQIKYNDLEREFISLQLLFSLTFSGPCSIVMYSYNESQRVVLFLRFI